MKIITKENISELFDEKSKYIGFNGVSISDMVINPDTLNGKDRIYHISHCRFSNVTFENIKMHDITCRNTDFNMVTFKNCVFSQLSSFTQCALLDTKFESCSLDGTSFSSCNFIRSSFEYCTFSQVLNTSIRYSYIGLWKTYTEDKIPEAFLNHCYLVHPIILEYCQVSMMGAGPNVSLVSNEEDLKSIYLKSLIRIGAMNPEILTIGPIGSRHEYTTYIPCIDCVQCGCWTEDEFSKDLGGSLPAFEARVKKEYGDNETWSDRSIYFEEYMNAINIFKLARKKYLNSKSTASTQQ